MSEDKAAEIEALRREAAVCRACSLWKNATQTVFGEGPADADILFVGEQPGDREDRVGRPFVGPAGLIFDKALADAGIDRRRAYVTNAVKHFKFEPRGKLRLHKRPNVAEINVCRRWLFAEIEVLRPSLVVALGATAAQSLAGRPVAIGKNRGDTFALESGLRVFVTAHPSSLLRAPDEAAREAAYALFVKDFALSARSPRRFPGLGHLSERRDNSAPAGTINRGGRCRQISPSPNDPRVMHFEPGFLASIIVILLTARLFGEAAQRLGQPAVMGQLIAGIVLGPSFFGLFLPHAEQALFSANPAQKAVLQGFAEFGVLLLLMLTGMEVDLSLLRRIGWASLSISLTGIAVPFACGAALGLLAPSSLIPNAGQRLATALFLGVSLSISSIKIVAMVVRDMNFARRDLGQIIIASSIIEDSLGWIIISIILGIAGAGAVEIGRLTGTIVGVALFVVVSLTIGRRLVADAIRLVNDAFAGEFMVLTLILAIMGAMALITQAIGVQTVLGTFVAGVLIGESPILTKQIAEQLRSMIAALFAPIFFALAGLNSDLTFLKSPEALALAVSLVVVASVGKFAGAFLGGAIGRLSRAESLALAIGMNARGSTEIIVASIGLSVGALTPTLFSMIVAMAVLTTCVMPPTLRWALARTPFRPGEQERLDREAFEAKGFVANMERFLVAASDHANGRLASRLVGILAGSRGQPATVLNVQSRSAPLLPQAEGRSMADDLKAGADHARATRPEEAAETRDVAVKARPEGAAFEDALSEEAPKGYDLLVIGLDPAQMPEGGFNPKIAASAHSFDGPVAVVIARGVHKQDPSATLKILALITGAANARRAAEVAIELARAARAELTILLLSAASTSQRRRALLNRHEDAALKEIVEIADGRDQNVRILSRSAKNWPNAILREADAMRATLIVLGVSVQPGEALLFGETANDLLEKSPQSVLFVAS
jgi:uracil-DNA glycosylase family protein